MARKSVTIRDVARHAGVSVATASRALNGKDVVNPQTRDRILSVMEELGFSPSPAARRLSLGRTLTVGVVVSFLTRPQAAERLRGVDAVLTDSEFDLVIYNVESVQKRDHYLGTLAQSQRTDGLIVMSLPPPDVAVPLLSRGPVPVVFIDVHTPSIAAMPRVVGDDAVGGALAARHLLDLGHTAIGFVGDALQGPFGFTSSRDREQGLIDELARAGASIPTAWVGHGAHGRYEARELAHQMLSGEHRPTAIFAASDTQALGVIAAASEAGLHVPDDLSVIGYDDIEAADYVGLTTIRQRLFESGRRGVEILLSEIDQRSDEPPVAHLAPELVVRATTATPKEAVHEDAASASSRAWIRTEEEELHGPQQIARRPGRHRTGRSSPGRSDRDPPGRGLCSARHGVVTVVGSDQHAGQRRGAERGGAVRQRGCCRSDLRHGSGRDERRLRDRVPDRARTRGRVHEAVPERDVQGQPGSVQQPDDLDPAPVVERHAAGPDPVADADLARQGRPAQEPR